MRGKSMRGELMPRERVTLALNHREPDRVPIDISYTWEPYVALREALGLPGEVVRPDVWSRVREKIDLVDALGTDFIRAGLSRSSTARSFSFFQDDEYTDEYGIYFRKVQRRGGGIQFEMRDYPLKEPTMDALEAFNWPDPNDPARYVGVQERIQHLYESTDYAIIMRLGGNVFEKSSYMRGQENWMMDLVLYPDFAVALMQRLADIQWTLYQKGLDLVGPYISIIRLGGEDLGTQRGLLLSPDTFRTLVKPILGDLYGKIKERFLNRNPNGKLMMHSCGGVRWLLPDFIEIGVDVLDPLQPQAAGMNGLALKREFGARLSFHGGLDTQGVLPFGTEEAVELEVRRKLEMFAPGGGYILNPSHNVLGDVPPANLIRMVEVGKRLGRYPIRRTFSDEELLAL
jgi:uroporphyrinogen decarboxylase